MIYCVRLRSASLDRGAFIVFLLFVVGMTTLHAQPATDAERDSKRVDTSKAGGSRAGSGLPSINDFVELDKEPAWDRDALHRRIRYPREAMRAGLQGSVIIRVLIDTTGRIVDYAFDKRADDLLDSAALDAVRSTPFTPAMNKGRPVAAWIQIDVHFKLE